MTNTMREEQRLGIHYIVNPVIAMANGTEVSQQPVQWS